MFLALIFAAPPLSMEAQLFPGLDAENIQLSTRPRSPEPQREFTVVSDAYSINTSGATIEWFVDGVRQPDFTDLRELTAVAPDIGQTMRVEMRINLLGGEVLSRDIVITPTRLSITIEGDTMTPTFYKGRTRPSPGSPIRAIAIITDGSNRPFSAYSYNWTLNNKPIYGGPVKGKYVTEISTIKNFENTANVGVEVYNPNGSLVATKIIGVPILDPELYFYEDNALRGTSRNVIQSPLIQTANEIDVRAEPYYLEKDFYSNNHLLEWGLNGQEIENPNSDPQLITLRRSGDRGNFKISFHVRNLEDILQGARGEFSVQY